MVGALFEVHVPSQTPLAGSAHGLSGSVRSIGAHVFSVPSTCRLLRSVHSERPCL